MNSRQTRTCISRVVKNCAQLLVLHCILLAPRVAEADLVTNTSQFGTPISVIDFSQFAGCTSFGAPSCQNQDVGGLVGETVMFTGTNGFLGASLYNDTFGLGTNGRWNSDRNGYVGINNQGGSGIFAEFEFTQGVSDVGAFVNYAPGSGGSPLIQVFDINHVLLESYDISVNAPISTPGAFNDGAFRGIHRTSADIFFVRFTDGFTVLDDLSFARLQDSDNDGIPDDEDACPNSDLSETIVIDGCDSGVGNLLFVDGCTMADLIAECAEGAVNHGQFVSCVAHLTNEWSNAGLINGQEKGSIESCAARSDIPGDLDGDGAVGVADLVILLGEWGQCPGRPDTCPADIDLDDIVGIADLLILLGNWG